MKFIIISSAYALAAVNLAFHNIIHQILIEIFLFIAVIW